MKILVSATILSLAAALTVQGESRIASRLESGEPLTIVTYGTSLTFPGPWVKQVKAVFDRKYPGQVNLVNSGKGGESSKWGLANLEERVLSKQPDAVSIEFAINDAYDVYKISTDLARSNLVAMIDRILEVNADCEIILQVMNPPTGIQLDCRPDFLDHYQMYRDVAKERGYLLIDHYPAWERILTEDPELFAKYVPDGVHPTKAASSIIITPAVLKALGIDD